MNASMKELLDLLLVRHAVLSRKMDDVTDPALGRAIVMEMQEILHRADLVQNLLMIETAQRLTTAVGQVKEANEELKEQLKDIQDVMKFIKGVSKFLASVDKAIDLAKAVAIL